MIYKLPFYSLQKAVYSALSSKGGLEWFDSATGIDSIASFFKNAEEFAYGIINPSSADCLPNKDTALWEVSLTLEIFSNYKGSKVVEQELELLLNYFSNDTGWERLQQSLGEDGYSLSSVTVGSINMNLPVRVENYVWQSGTTTLTFRLTQMD